MEFEWLKIEEQWKWEKIEKSQAETKLKEIWEIKNHLENTTNSSDTEIKQKLESNTKMQWEIVQFIEDAANNKLNWWLDKFNSKNYDKDNEAWLDNFEFANFEKSVNWAIDQIIKLDWVKDMQSTYDDTNDKWWLSSPDKWLANKLWVSDNINDLLKWWSFTEEWLKKLWISEEDMKKMSEKQFDITSVESLKELWILTTKELWEWAESILKLLLNVLPSIILLPRYMAYRVESNASDSKEAEVWQIKLDELSSQNPALEMLNLLWEKWVEMLQKLWDMVKSGKQWDIAMMLVSIASLIAWWAGLVKTWAKMARKEMVMSARAAWREARMNAKINTRENRNMLRDFWNQAGKVADKANKIDDTLSWINAIKTAWKVAGWLWTNEAWKQLEAANDASNKVEKVTELSDKEKLYYSNFTDKVPDSLKAEDPVAWINKDGTISYNKAKLEQEYWIKIDWNKWETTFNGMSLKEFTKQNPEKWQAIIDKLKNYKWHESTHRVLESKWIDRINVNINGQNRIFWQEEISHIVDWSHQISKEEFNALEKALQEKLWPHFKLDSDNIRRTDTKNISDTWNDKNTFSREKEAAKSPQDINKMLLDEITFAQKRIDQKLLKMADWDSNIAKEYFNQLFWSNKEILDSEIEKWKSSENVNKYLWEMREYLSKQEARVDKAIANKNEASIKEAQLKAENAQKAILTEKIWTINSVDDLTSFVKSRYPNNLLNLSSNEVYQKILALSDEQIKGMDVSNPWLKDAINRVKENKAKLDNEYRQALEKQQAKDEATRQKYSQINEITWWMDWYSYANKVKGEIWEIKQQNEALSKELQDLNKQNMQEVSQKYRLENTAKTLEANIQEYNNDLARLQSFQTKSLTELLADHKNSFIKSETAKYTELLNDAKTLYEKTWNKPGASGRITLELQQWMITQADISNSLKWIWRKVIYKEDLKPMIDQLEFALKWVWERAEKLDLSDAMRYRSTGIEYVKDKLWLTNLDDLKQQLDRVNTELKVEWNNSVSEKMWEIRNKIDNNNNEIQKLDEIIGKLRELIWNTHAI